MNVTQIKGLSKIINNVKGAGLHNDDPKTKGGAVHWPFLVCSPTPVDSLTMLRKGHVHIPFLNRAAESRSNHMGWGRTWSQPAMLPDTAVMPRWSVALPNADVYNECHYWACALHERSVPFKVQTAKVAATSDKHCLFKVFGRLPTVQPLPAY